MKHKQLIETLKSFVEEVSGKTGEKAVIDMARNLAGALAECEITADIYKSGYNRDVVFDPTCLLGNHRDIFAFATPEFLEFCKVMFQLRPIGLGAPNAMVGEGEFMALFCSPRVGIVKKKGFGDVSVGGKNVELKGAGTRIMGNVSGVGVQKHAGLIAGKYGVEANECSQNRTAFEPWEVDKSGHKIKHWIGQFNKLGKVAACKYLQELCNHFMQCEVSDFTGCFNQQGKFNAENLRRVILKKLFAGMERNWDFFTVIDGGKITALPNDENEFNAMVDSEKIKITDNYFRSFQQNNVGLYVKLV